MKKFIALLSFVAILLGCSKEKITNTAQSNLKNGCTKCCYKIKISSACEMPSCVVLKYNWCCNSACYYDSVKINIINANSANPYGEAQICVKANNTIGLHLFNCSTGLPIIRNNACKIKFSISNGVGQSYSGSIYPSTGTADAWAPSCGYATPVLDEK